MPSPNNNSRGSMPGSRNHGIRHYLFSCHMQGEMISQIISSAWQPKYYVDIEPMVQCLIAVAILERPGSYDERVVTKDVCDRLGPHMRMSKWDDLTSTLSDREAFLIRANWDHCKIRTHVRMLASYTTEELYEIVMRAWPRVYNCLGKLVEK